MSDVAITVKLPSELIERAQRVGLNIEDQAYAITEAVEKEVRRREAGQRLEQIATELRSLPPELKPTPEEIDAEIRAYRSEKASSSSNSA